MSDNIHILELSGYEAPVIKESKRENWVDYGEDNDYYQFLIDRYITSTTNNAIINNINRLVYGRGLGATNASKKPNEYAHMMALLRKESVRHLVTDLKLLGQCAMQIIYTKDRKKIAQVEHIPVQLLRAEKCNEDGKIEAYYYSDDWTDIKKYIPKRVPAFGCSKDPIEIYFVKPYSVGMKYYALVDYTGGIPYCVLEENISEYLINEVENGFSGRSVVNFNNGQPSDDQQRLIKNKVLNQLTGMKGEKLIVSFNSNAESKTTVDSMPVNDAPDLYSTLSEECLRKIMLSHNVTSPLLFGIASSNGFSSNAEELKDSFALFSNMIIMPMQEMLIDAFDQILAYNKIHLNLFFKTLKPLEFVDLENTQTEEQIQEETGLELSSLNTDLQDFINKGEDTDQEGYDLIDVRDVDYDMEEDFDLQVDEWEASFEPKKSLLSKIINLVGTGRAAPNKPSEQDREIKGVYFKVRYEYVGTDAPQRQFCRAMRRARKIYRKEDIEKLSSLPVNKGFGEHGAATYSIWLFKGGPRCHHKWQRRTYASFRRHSSIGAADSVEVSTNKAQKFGYRVDNNPKVSQIPNIMKDKGFSPNNPNIPKDAR
tara:strand:- start:1297 stop:3084 length:1788 start_codon:yes stop_codon:yes gene_type:complete